MQTEEINVRYKELGESGDRYFNVFNLAPIGYVIISESGDIIEANLMVMKDLMVETKEIRNSNISDFIYEEDKLLFQFHNTALFKTHRLQDWEMRMERRDGTPYWGHLKANLFTTNGPKTCCLTISDITEKKLIQQTLIESELKYRLICTTMEQGLALFDIRHHDGNVVEFIYLYVNDSYLKLFDMTQEECIGNGLHDFMPINDEKWMPILENVCKTEKPEMFESFYPSKGKSILTYAYCPQKNQVALLVSDITDRVNKQNEIAHMSYHDRLTGMYNRRFFEEELLRLDTKRNLPLSIAMGDINGLKLLNDSFGHATGDLLIKMVADMIKTGCRSDDISARLSGDEFVIILPQSNREESLKVLERIMSLLDDETIESIKPSISFGCATKKSVDEDIADIFKKAEAAMYNHKLKESPAVKRQIIDLIVKRFFHMNPKEALHAKRVSEISRKIAISMGYKPAQVEIIRLAGLMHDVGKIGISEKLLSKKGKLSDDEWNELKRHPEIGYHILSSSNEFAEIASIVLEHHEKWNGQGYPKGLEGEEISIPARIIAIANLFDSLTHNSFHKNDRTIEEATVKLNRLRGIQFDAEILDIFLREVVMTL